MDNTSLAHPTRTVFVDDQLFEEIADLTGIEYRVLSSAFAGEEKNLALDVVKTAVAENPQGTPEEWQNSVLAWAKENGSGEYRPGYWDSYVLSYEYNEYLRRLLLIPYVLPTRAVALRDEPRTVTGSFAKRQKDATKVTVQIHL